MQRALAASIGVAEWMTKENVLWLPAFCNFRQRNHPHVSAPHHALFLPVSTNVFYFYTNFISNTPLLRIFYSWSKHKRMVQTQYSRTPLIRPPSESHWCGRIRLEGWSLVRDSYTNRNHCPSHEMWSYERDGRW